MGLCPGTLKISIPIVSIYAHTRPRKKMIYLFHRNISRSHDDKAHLWCEQFSSTLDRTSLLSPAAVGAHKRDNC
jgi:hypothetical protein